MIETAHPSAPLSSSPPAAETMVAEIARQRLRQSPYPILRRIHCRYHAGVLMLTGEVPTFYMKQIAQTLVRDVEQVEQIENRLIVDSSPRR